MSVEGDGDEQLGVGAHTGQHPKALTAVGLTAVGNDAKLDMAVGR